MVVAEHEPPTPSDDLPGGPSMSQTPPSRPTPPATCAPCPTPPTPRAMAEAILFEVRRVIVGQDQMLERILVGLLSGGHILLEGVPGLAKTLTIKTLADVLGGSFKRIQFTPDLMPSDLVGTRIYRPADGTFETELGPVFANFLLADEINRAPAKVQSRAARGHAGAPGHDRRRDPQGPRAVHRPGHREPDRGRGHLPAARGPGRPVHAQDRRRLSRTRPRRRRSSPARCARACRRARSSTPRAWPPCSAASTTCTSTRGSSATRSAWSRPPASSPTGAPRSSRATSPYGASPRGSINLVHGARALAVLRGRRYVLPSDVAELAPDVLRHRLVLSYAALTDGITPDAVITRVLGLVPAPQLDLAAQPSATA